MTDTNKYQEYDIITIIIVLVSCIITTLLNELRCLISQNSKPSIPTPGKHVGPSKTTKRTSNSKTKNQPRSRSTKPSSGTVDQKKVAGGSVKATPKKRTASSRRSKQSGSTCNSQTSTKSFVDQPSLGDTTTSSNWELSFSNDYARMYPTERPYYC